MLEDVLCVPQRPVNLLSVAALCDSKLEMVFNQDACTVFRLCVEKFKARRKNSTYTVAGSMSTKEGCYAQVGTIREEDHAQLWHDRLDHAHGRSIQGLVRRNAVLGLHNVAGRDSIPTCTGCLHGKQHKVLFHRNKHRSRLKGEVIHSDVCGALHPVSLGGSMYYVSFIDEPTRYTTVLSIPQKSDVSATFRKYHRCFELKFGCTTKSLHCDGGREYI